MKGEVKRYEWGGSARPITAAKRDICGNTYLVQIRPVDDDAFYSHNIYIFGDVTHGEDHGFEKTPRRNSEYDLLVKEKVRHEDDLSGEVSKAVDDAVRKMTSYLEHASSQEDAALGALEANAEYYEEQDNS